MLKTKNAFTLAEIMVTLAVLGVLAAIMLPAIGAIRPDKNKAMFKKAYFVAERMVYELVNDTNLYPALGSKIGLDDTSAVLYNGISYGSDSESEDGHHKSKFCELFARKVNTISDKLNCVEGASTFGEAGPSFITTDGVAWYLPVKSHIFRASDEPDAAENVESIYVDVNNEKAPNCLDGANGCPKPDRFEIKVHADGKMEVTGDTAKEYLKSNSSLQH